jgi:hypothetical protein
MKIKFELTKEDLDKPLDQLRSEALERYLKIQLDQLQALVSLVAKL